MSQENKLIGLLLSPTIPAALTAGVTIACFIPLLVIVLGSSFSFINTINAYLHVILECASVIVALFVAVLSFVQYGINKNIAVPVIGISLAFSGVMDGVHIFVSLAAALDSGEPSQVEPFSWSLVRTFSALNLLVAIVLLLFLQKSQKPASLVKMLVATSFVFTVTFSVLISLCITSNDVPETVFRDDFITRPYDVFALVIWIFCGAFIFPLFKKYFPGVFADALSLMVLPSVMAELHMVFGSSAVYDAHYFAAHYLKIVAFAVPLMGLLLDYYLVFRRDQLKTLQLHQTYREVEERTHALLKANRELEKFSNYKSEFMASMSHELRTPLNSIIGFSRILMRDHDNESHPRSYRANEAISRNATQLLAVINDIIDISRIDSGKMSVNKTDFIVSDIIAEVKEKLSSLAEDKNLEFNIINYARNIAIVSDKVKFKQVLMNLGENAIKYTEAGSVVISIERKKESPIGNAIKISFKDTGVGIPDSDKEMLFSAIGRPDDAEAMDMGGTTLGLMISARLTLLLGGYMDFESEPGVGTEFRIYFPIAESEELISSAPEGLWHRKGLAVVCVDADLDLLTYFEMAFDGSGVSLFTESSGNRLMKLCEDVLPDVVCFDADMPEKSGRVVLRELYDHSLMTNIPKIALSSNHELEHSLIQEGADLFLRKPCAGEDLCDRAKSLALREITSLIAVGVEADHALQLQAEFESLGMKIFLIDTAESALEKMTQFLPDCLIINIGNEQADATRLLVSIKNDEQCRKIPQVLYNGLELQRRQAFSNEAQEEVRAQKPTAEDLLAAVFTLRRRVKTSLMRIEALNRSLKENEPHSQRQAIIEISTGSEPKKEENCMLVIEHSQDNLALVEWILEDAHISFDSVLSGRDALKVVLEKHYVMVLMDINLPDLDGREVTRRLRATKAYRSVPIIAITVNSSVEEMRVLEAAGFDGVVAKPIDQERLLRVVRRHGPFWGQEPVIEEEAAITTDRT